MGKCCSKVKESAAEAAREENPAAPLKTLPTLTAGSSPSALTSFLESTLKADPKQMDFVKAWTADILEPLKGKSQNADTILVRADGGLFEHSVECSFEHVDGLCTKFLSDNGVEVGDFEQMKRVIEEEAKGQKATVVVWYRLKGLGEAGKGTDPSIDAGLTVKECVSWKAVEVVVPSSEDFEAFEEKAQADGAVVTSFGSSLFPSDPESRMTLQLPPEKAAFLFQGMGFPMPHPQILHAAGSLSSVSVEAQFGKDGLTFLGIHMDSQGSVSTLTEKATSLTASLPNSKADEEILKDFATRVADPSSPSASLVLYADSGGFCLALAAHISQQPGNTEALQPQVIATAAAAAVMDGGPEGLPGSDVDDGFQGELGGGEEKPAEGLQLPEGKRSSLASMSPKLQKASSRVQFVEGGEGGGNGMSEALERDGMGMAPPQLPA
uniref:Uncharacterized protein n=1 Tax=Chromera velia CCMP2878 TaxID=1169474 RepID=A0A0G4HWI2_9ALVE|eukprot:Cvel_9068.t1-p1 / transcript=Cvel_9068.t1 / gene=Cvel_9068 / organism=Chromera_velia_CCMP2878 / gene_product=hypothetical protein / transcript_product=hypothetical protein / location=Cvel_scaffold514:53672-54982(-) / protein_length=437 / sequence_SO=supercontig / SO=protein_coding / is_pseudo=false